MNREDFSQPATDELRKSIRSNRRIIRLSRNWLKIALAFFFLYTGVSLLPPFLMQAGLEGPANVIYTIYSPMCHQFAFRSWFLFGDQLVYPRAVSGTALGTFEEYAVRDPHFEGVNLDTWSVEMQTAARSFTGNEEMGYKTALCERDVLIYGTMFLVGLLYAGVRKWLRPAPIWLYLVLGLAPIGLDGFSQMFGYPPFEYWPVRETLPYFRVLTGFLFGMMNVWLAFPYLEQSMVDTVQTLERKVAIAEQRLMVLEAGD
jgi:uncharacterized membrane protein